MPYTDQLVNSGSALLGAAMLEIIYWRDLRQSLEATKYKKLLGSRDYWILTGLFVVGSALGSLIWLHDQKARLQDYFILGAAFGPTVKSVARTGSKGRVLGGDDHWKTYLMSDR